MVQWQHDWARGAVFYEVLVRSFEDSDGDGVGDLRGLTASWYRNLIKVRHASAALKKGDFNLLTPGDRSSPVLAFTRQSGKERVLVIHNLSANEVQAGPFQIPGKRMDLLLGPNVKPVKGADGWTVTLPPGASGVWRVR